MENILQLFIIAAVAVSPAITKWGKDKIKKTGEAFSKNLKIRAEIAALVKEVQIRFDANRVSIFEYSNTEKAINGLPFDYVTMTYEETSHYTEPVGTNIRKIPIGQFAAILIEIDQAEKWVEHTLDHHNMDVVYNLKAFGVVKEYHFKLTSHIRDGVMTIAFMREVPDFDQEKIEYVKFKCWEIYNLMRKLK